MCELSELEKRYVEVSSDCEKYLSEYKSCISSNLNGTVISKGPLYNLLPMK